ncbi:MAG: hypothetical protein J6T10_22915 [Methanobrevibacter sp.]|nr:hypothetical protein [Methanobrevibacter sp.]
MLGVSQPSLISFPVVPSNTAKCQLVELEGHTTSPLQPPPVALITLLVISIPVQAVKVSCLPANAVDKSELSTKSLSLSKSDVFVGIVGLFMK